MDSLCIILRIIIKESITTNKCDIVALLLCNTRVRETTISVDYYGEWRGGWKTTTYFDRDNCCRLYHHSSTTIIIN